MTDHAQLRPMDICGVAAELVKSLLWPLNLFYAQDGREMPELTPLFEQQIPEPYRKLLVHANNMTPTLETYHSGMTHIEPLHILSTSSETTREIVLRRDVDDKPVEYGASHIFFEWLCDPAIKMIKEGHVPLGTVLHVCGCKHTVHPAGYFRIRPNSFFSQVFDSVHESSLFGRRTTLVSLEGDTLAEVCEILPLEAK